MPRLSRLDKSGPSNTSPTSQNVAFPGPFDRPLPALPASGPTSIPGPLPGPTRSAPLSVLLPSLLGKPPSPEVDKLVPELEAYPTLVALHAPELAATGQALSPPSVAPLGLPPAASSLGSPSEKLVGPHVTLLTLPPTTSSPPPGLRLSCGSSSALAGPHPPRNPVCLDRSAPGKLFSYRRSLRLAAKNKGVHKSSLIKAQELMCRKLKLARLASKLSRPSTSSSSASSSSSTGILKISGPPPTLVAVENNPGAVPPPTAEGFNHAFPLSQGDIHRIKISCGIFDDGPTAPAVKTAPPLPVAGVAAGAEGGLQ